ncbi:Myeloma overexpressed gene 2 protein-like protein [Heterocephalus glaber]|uniref:COP9 signalosome complex subunit 9 n=2 Tax=Boreoeutheria TaxID=1437010 RepID=G5BGW9_HETGA|nr:Myeloma overexpressed gene 2 protein-like protein [Heterocephalus glaber]
MKPAVDEMFPEGAGPYVDLDEVRQQRAAAARRVGRGRLRGRARAPSLGAWRPTPTPEPRSPLRDLGDCWAASASDTSGGHDLDLYLDLDLSGRVPIPAVAEEALRAGGSTGLLMDLAANEKAVHADFFNDFEDLFDDDDVQ